MRLLNVDVPGRHVPVAAVALAAHGGAGLAEVAVDDVGEVRRAVRAEVRAGRGVHGLLVHDAARVQAVDDARLKGYLDWIILFNVDKT